METLSIFLALVAILIGLAYVYVKNCYSYWKKKNVPYLKPKFPLGNMKSILPKGIALGNISYDFYQEFKKKGYKYGGVFIGLDPALVIVDPNYLKTIFIKDFEHFVDRGIYMTEKVPITVSIFAQSGTDWKNIRHKMSPVFSTSKMKMYFKIMKRCCDQADTVLEKCDTETLDLDILQLMACYTTDVIGDVVYGLECNSFKNPDAEFRKMGKKLFDEFTLRDQINLFLTVYYPNLSRKIGVTNIQKEVDDFFTKCVIETIEYREKNNVRRQDMLDMLIEMKNSGVMNLTMAEVISQTFLFFSAGYETSSTTLTFCLYELAKRQDIQDRLRDEIHAVLEKYKGELNYDSIHEMKYLGQVVDETLRLWPPVATVPRVCSKTYNLPDSDLVIEAGTRIIVPALAMHRDEDYWPDPLTWNPDRFEDDDGKNKPYMPFGIGPRNCIGARFGAIQVRIGLVTVLRKYKVFVSPNTVEPIEMDPDSFVLHSKNKILLRVKHI